MAISGFLLFIIGMLSLVLSVIGIHFTFLRFLEYWGAGFAFASKILIIIAGFVLIYLSKTDYPRKE